MAHCRVLPCKKTATDRDRGALLALFGSTGGANWSEKDNWGTDADLSQWHGVLVNEGRVVKLDLESNNLRGDVRSLFREETT